MSSKLNTFQKNLHFSMELFGIRFAYNFGGGKYD